MVEFGAGRDEEPKESHKLALGADLINAATKGEAEKQYKLLLKLIHRMQIFI